MARLLRNLLAVSMFAITWVLLTQPIGGTEPPELALLLSTDTDTFLVGEPVQIRLRLENRRDEDVTGDFYLSYDLDRLRILVARNGGEFSPYVSKAMEIAGLKKRLAEPVTIAAGAAIEEVEFVSFDVKKDALALPAAGTYQLQALLFYNNYDQELSSNVLSLTVVDPTDANRAALDFLQANNLERFLTPEASLFPSDEDAIRQLKVFLDSFPDSTYASYAQAAFDAVCESSVAMDTVPDDCPSLNFCVGDCQGTGTVMIGDLILGVNILLGNSPVSDCRNFDREGDRQVSINDLIIGVNHALDGCSVTTSNE